MNYHRWGMDKGVEQTLHVMKIKEGQHVGEAVPNTIHLSISQSRLIIRIFRLGWQHNIERIQIELVFARRWRIGI